MWILNSFDSNLLHVEASPMISNCEFILLENAENANAEKAYMQYHGRNAHILAACESSAYSNQFSGIK